MNRKWYAGVGSRETPPEILLEMTQAAMILKAQGYLLRSGGAEGADDAFVKGAAPVAQIHLPWQRYNQEIRYPGVSYLVPEWKAETEELAAKYHPVWPTLSQGVKKLMCRNITIVAGISLDEPVEFGICWTRSGRVSGGTGQAIRYCHDIGIRMYNLASEVDRQELLNKIVPE